MKAGCLYQAWVEIEVQAVPGHVRLCDRVAGVVT